MTFSRVRLMYLRVIPIVIAAIVVYGLTDHGWPYTVYAPTILFMVWMAFLLGHTSARQRVQGRQLVDELKTKLFAVDTASLSPRAHLQLSIAMRSWNTAEEEMTYRPDRSIEIAEAGLRHLQRLDEILKKQK